MSILPATAPQATTAFGAEVLRHLRAQLESSRRLLDCVLRQGAAVRARDVDTVLDRLADIQGEMERRGRLERDRTTILQRAATALGVPAHTVTVDALASLMDAAEGAAARAASAELRGLVTEIGREHQVNRALMRQELAFLSHLTRMLGGDDDHAAYGPPAGPGAAMRAPFPGPAAPRRVLDLEA